MATDTGVAAARRLTANRGSSGPAPGRIVAAAASVSAGLGLMALLAATTGTQTATIESRPTSVALETTSDEGSLSASATGRRQEQVGVVEGPVPTLQATTSPEPVSRSEGS